MEPGLVESMEGGLKLSGGKASTLNANDAAEKLQTAEGEEITVGKFLLRTLVLAAARFQCLAQ